jgi:hypothetical protein
MNRGFIASLIVALSLAGCAYQPAAFYPSYPQPPASVDVLAANLSVQYCAQHKVKPKTKQFSDCVAKAARSKRIRAAALRMQRHDAETYPQRVQQYQAQMQRDQLEQQQQQAAWQNANNTFLQMQAQQRASMPPPNVPTTTNCRVIGGNTLNCTSF